MRYAHVAIFSPPQITCLPRSWLVFIYHKSFFFFFFSLPVLFIQFNFFFNNWRMNLVSKDILTDNSGSLPLRDTQSTPIYICTGTRIDMRIEVYKDGSVCPSYENLLVEYNFSRRVTGCSGYFRSILLRCGTSTYEWGTQWDALV